MHLNVKIFSCSLKGDIMWYVQYLSRSRHMAGLSWSKKEALLNINDVGKREEALIAAKTMLTGLIQKGSIKIKQVFLVWKEEIAIELN